MVAENKITNEVLLDFQRVCGWIPEKDGKYGLVLLDFATFCPDNPGHIEDYYFELEGGTRTKATNVLKKRFPNPWYHTQASCINGRASKCGCYLALPIAVYRDIRKFLFFDRIRNIWHSFPVRFNLSQDKPVAALGMTFGERMGDFVFQAFSESPDDPHTITAKCYTTDPLTAKEKCSELLSAKEPDTCGINGDGESSVIRYEGTIEISGSPFRTGNAGVLQAGYAMPLAPESEIEYTKNHPK